MKKRKQPSSSNRAAHGVDLPEIERLLDFMQEHGLEECEYERSGLRIRLKKAPLHPQGVFRTPSGSEMGAGPPGPSASTSSALPRPPAEAGESAAQRTQEKAAHDDLHIIKSPIVGTFYASPTPGAEVFVRAGDSVDVGQVLCIIEAMKLMNEIESDVAGQLVRILVENGQPVEYGEPLFAIQPKSKK
jgi:acetyl-CoA carboxylase biotin carboxyl carrier protein